MAQINTKSNYFGNWQNNRIKFMLDKYGSDFFKDKKILERNLDFVYPIEPMYKDATFIKLDRIPKYGRTGPEKRNPDDPYAGSIRKTRSDKGLSRKKKIN